MAWAQFPDYWIFVCGIHRQPVDYQPKGLAMGSFDNLFIISMNELLNEESSCE